MFSNNETLTVSKEKSFNQFETSRMHWESLNVDSIAEGN